MKTKSIDQGWPGNDTAWPRPKSQIIEAVMFRSLRQRRGAKGLLSIGTLLALTTLTAALRRPCRSLGSHITWDLADAPSNRGNSQKRMNTYRMRSATPSSKHENDEVNGEFSLVSRMSSLAGCLSHPPTASLFALFSPASVSNLPKTCWRLKPQVSLYFRMINSFPLWHTGSNFFLIKTILTVIFLAGECAGMETAEICWLLLNLSEICEEFW